MKMIPHCRSSWRLGLKMRLWSVQLQQTTERLRREQGLTHCADRKGGTDECQAGWRPTDRRTSCACLWYG
jgi:hypothetical protein